MAISAEEVALDENLVERMTQVRQKMSEIEEKSSKIEKRQDQIDRLALNFLTR